MSIKVIRTEKDMLIERTPFFSVKQEEIKFKFPLKDTKGSSVKGVLVYEPTGSRSVPLVIPVEDGMVSVGIKNFEGFLSIGSYRFEVETDEGKTLQLPFIMAREVVAEEGWVIKFELPMKDSQGNLIEKELDVKLQIINIDKKSVMLDKDTRIITSTDLGLKIENKDNKLVPGRYEFRMVRDDRVLYRMHYIVK